MIIHKSFVFNPFQENTYVVSSESKQCLIIDPGCYGKEDEQILENYILENELTPKAIWLTHAHIDHVLGLNFCVEKWNIPYCIHYLEVAQLKAVEVYAPNYGFHDYKPVTSNGTLLDSSEILLDNLKFSILNVPGHSPGHVAFYHSDSAQIWAGDVLFRQSIGRTDLPGGNFEILKKSILEKLFILPDNTTVYSGHGPETKIGFEKRNNPYISI